MPGMPLNQSLLEDAGSGPITRRKVHQKRSIHGVCEHFEVLSNAVIAFKIKILGALSVGDGRKKAYPLPAAFPKSLS